MRVAIDCRSILKQHSTGIGRYTYELINHFARLEGYEQWLRLYIRKSLFDLKRRLPAFNARGYCQLHDYFGLGLPKAIDILHLPSPGIIPRFDGRIIVTIHDLIHRAYPQSHTRETIELTEKYLKALINRADYFICISHSTKNDLHRFYQVPLSKIAVVYNGVNRELFYPSTGSYHGRPYLLFVGTIEPRKNLKGVLEAFAQFKKNDRQQILLKVVGMKGWMCDDIQPLIQQLGLRNDVEFLGFVDDQQLRDIYSFALALVFPSFYEGFGFPIVEAFACATPVMTSQNSSCGEIAGDAGLLVDPHNIESMANAMKQLVENNDLRDRLRAKGLGKVDNFTFLECAKATREIYEISGR